MPKITYVKKKREMLNYYEGGAECFLKLSFSLRGALGARARGGGVLLALGKESGRGLRPPEAEAVSGRGFRPPLADAGRGLRLEAVESGRG